MILGIDKDPKLTTYSTDQPRQLEIREVWYRNQLLQEFGVFTPGSMSSSLINYDINLDAMRVRISISWF